MKAYGIPLQSLSWKQQSPLQSSLSQAVTATTVPPSPSVGVHAIASNGSPLQHHHTSAININSFIKAEPVITHSPLSTVSAVVASPPPVARVGSRVVNQPVIATATPGSPLPLGAVAAAITTTTNSTASIKEVITK